MIDDPVAGEGAAWEVVGGADHGGILVRSAADVSSPQLGRLSTGARVRELERAPGDRVRYELLSGAGPPSGWVSASVRGRELLARPARPPPAPPGAARAAGPACSAEELEAALPVLRWYSEQLELGRDVAHRTEDGGRPAAGERWRELAAQSTPAAWLPTKGAVGAVDARSGVEVPPAVMPVGRTGGMMKIAPLRQPTAPSLQADGGCAAGWQSCGPAKDPRLAKVVLPGGSRPSRRQQPLLAAASQPGLQPAKGQEAAGVVSAVLHDMPPPSEQSDENFQERSPCQQPQGDEGPRCPRCRLPIGDWGYFDADSEGELMHSECRAQLLLEVARKDDRAREAQDAVLKQAHRRQHGIGWSAERVPTNAAVTRALSACDAAQGLCCLVLDGPARTVRIVPTVDAATGVNLEYLSLALQVRRQEGREPLFSLDPVDAPADRPQDLLQRKRFEPAWLAGTSVGDVMFQADYHLKELSMGEYEQPVVGMKSCLDLAEEDSARREWRAREWFVVKQAGIYLSDGNVLTPHVRMGVEAREQIRGPKGMEDARLTRRDHPLVRYAEAFTRNFDLIAERKSVIYHLRELAKASVLAKYLVEDKVALEEAWFEAVRGGAGDPGPSEVPQLWNERRHARIRVRDGRLVDAERGVSTSTHGVYGGVAFQLEEVPTMQAARLPRAGATVTARQLALAGGGKARSFGQIPGAPKGVDLNLDGFDLSAPVPLPRAEQAEAAPEASAACAKAFWFSLACNSGSVFAADDRRFFKALFNPHLSDRQQEGQRFALPQTSFGYIEGLRRLIKKEEDVQESRRRHFLSKDFLEDQAGSLYPGSWDSSIAIAREHARKASPAAAPREGWLPSGATAAHLQSMLKTAAPVFDKCTEDGSRFRIYRLGSFEVRTTQRHDEKEAIGVVFSSAADSAAPPPSQERRVNSDEKIVKATEYVEAVEGLKADGPRPPCHYFAVLTSAAGGAIVAERLADGAVAWTENPQGLEARCALARVTGCSDARGAGVTLADLREPGEAAWWGEGAEGANSQCLARRCLELVLPAGRKGWCALAASQRRAVARLGVETAEGWDARAAPVWRLSWWDLTEQQRSAAQALGISDDTWEELAQRVPGPQAESKEG